MIELALVKFLLADPIVSNLSGGRVFPMRAYQARDVGMNTFPRLTFQRTSTSRVGTTDGRTYLARATIQLDAWGQGATGYQDAKSLADAVRLARGGDQGKSNGVGYAQLDGFAGKMAGVTVQAAWLDNDADSYEPPAHDEDLGAYRTSMDLTIWWTETAGLALP